MRGLACDFMTIVLIAALYLPVQIKKNLKFTIILHRERHSFFLLADWIIYELQDLK